MASRVDTLISNTIQTKTIGATYNGNTYLKAPVVLYDQRVGLSVTGGTNVVIKTITIPANLMGTDGDTIEVDIEGNGNGAGTTRNISISINGTGYEGFNLNTGQGNMWRMCMSLSRSGASNCDVNGFACHFTTATTFGNVNKGMTTAFTSTGSINIRTTSTTTGDILVQSIRAVYYPAQA
uniref:Uncharacterized protein n=1 Tax=Clandestinovirus TaxID=2831644 RepID=A0A8F8PMM1_9VIRU|nr:hypothetical protein KOM_12_382 [Clandestinovirus]